MKYLYIVDYWVPFPSSEYGGVIDVISHSDEECFDLLKDWREDYNSDFDNLYGPEGYLYKVNNGELDCLNCPSDENKDIEIETVSGEVLGNENVVKTTTIKDSIEKVSVKVNGKEIINTEVRKSHR